MIRRRRRIPREYRAARLAAALLAIFSTSGSAAALTDQDVAGVLNGKPVTLAEVDAALDAIASYDSDYISYAKYVNTADSRAVIRNKLANFLGCSNSEVAITNNTTEGMAFGTLGLDFKRGDEIIYTNHDHSGGAQPVNLCAARQGMLSMC